MTIANHKVPNPTITRMQEITGHHLVIVVLHQYDSYNVTRIAIAVTAMPGGSQRTARVRRAASHAPFAIVH